MATACPKPPKSEKGPGSKRKGRSKAWESTEREAARWLQEHSGVDPSPPVPLSSTGRCGAILRYDASSAVYCGEAKRRLLPKWLFVAWAQICFLAHERGTRHPVMILDFVSEQKTAPHKGKNIRVPRVHCITEDRHAELLSYEALVKGDDRSEITKDRIFEYIEIVDSEDAESSC